MDTEKRRQRVTLSTEILDVLRESRDTYVEFGELQASNNQELKAINNKLGDIRIQFDNGFKKEIVNALKKHTQEHCDIMCQLIEQNSKLLFWRIIGSITAVAIVLALVVQLILALNGIPIQDSPVNVGGLQ